MPNRHECPYKRAEDEDDVYRREEIILEAELEGGEDEVENEVEGKRQSDHPRNLPPDGFVKNGAERNRNNCVKHGPNGPKNPSRRSPIRLNQRCVPSVRIHPAIIQTFCKTFERCGDRDG